jgi:hypothetical protein
MQFTVTDKSLWCKNGKADHRSYAGTPQTRPRRSQTQPFSLCPQCFLRSSRVCLDSHARRRCRLPDRPPHPLHPSPSAPLSLPTGAVFSSCWPAAAPRSHLSLSPALAHLLLDLHADQGLCDEWWGRRDLGDADGAASSSPEASRHAGHLGGAGKGANDCARQDRRAHCPPVRLPHPRAPYSDLTRVLQPQDC